jgi:acetyltransferase-like isoleucine patch superfamily enzyme
MTNFFEKNSKISKLASIEISKKNTKIMIGAFSVIDDFVKIKCVGGVGDVIIGKYVYINSGTVLYSGNGIDIGDNTLIGPNCSIISTNHEFKNKKKLIREQGFQGMKNGVKIEDDVWIGANVVILDGAVIRKGSVIGANSLVNSETEAYSINFGSPSRLVRFRK